MPEPFGDRYADSYDAIYADKDYVAECDALELIFGNHPRRIDSVLDIGCGTGGHALLLAARGYRVTGIDRSQSMLAQAALKARRQESDIRWVNADIRAFALKDAYDAAILMFAVIGYQHSDDDVLISLRNIRKHLEVDGLLVFDAWHGPTVLADQPGPRRKQIDDAGLVRKTDVSLDTSNHLCRVEFTLVETDSGDVISKELHVVRYFFPEEIALHLQATGFELIKIGRFEDINLEPDSTTQSITVVARAV